VDHYRRPDWFTRHLLNPLVSVLTRVGIGLAGSQVLEVTGRKSGQARRVPVNPLRYQEQLYLVAPRGTTEWVRNARAAGGRVVLIRGRHRDAYLAEELETAARPEILREYLRKWKWEVGQFFNGVGPDSTDQELATEADLHPVFRLTPAG
jgi:deazaflavin-dependent oxidoreductase (nitroreductase family)